MRSSESCVKLCGETPDKTPHPSCSTRNHQCPEQTDKSNRLSQSANASVKDWSQLATSRACMQCDNCRPTREYASSHMLRLLRCSTRKAAAKRMSIHSPYGVATRLRGSRQCFLSHLFLIRIAADARMLLPVLELWSVPCHSRGTQVPSSSLGAARAHNAWWIHVLKTHPVRKVKVFLALQLNHSTAPLENETHAC